MPALFGAKLRYLRREHKVTQVDLANKLGLASHTHVTKLEAGQRTASLELVVRVADLFKVTTDYLLRDSLPVELVEGVPQATTDYSGEQTAWPLLLGAKLRA